MPRSYPADQNWPAARLGDEPWDWNDAGRSGGASEGSRRRRGEIGCPRSPETQGPRHESNGHTGPERAPKFRVRGQLRSLGKTRFHLPEHRRHAPVSVAGALRRSAEPDGRDSAAPHYGEAPAARISHQHLGEAAIARRRARPCVGLAQGFPRSAAARPSASIPADARQWERPARSPENEADATTQPGARWRGRSRFC